MNLLCVSIRFYNQYNLIMTESRHNYVRITYDICVVSLLESREQRYIKAMNNNSAGFLEM